MSANWQIDYYQILAFGKCLLYIYYPFQRMHGSTDMLQTKWIRWDFRLYIYFFSCFCTILFSFATRTDGTLEGAHQPPLTVARWMHFCVRMDSIFVSFIVFLTAMQLAYDKELWCRYTGVNMNSTVQPEKHPSFSYTFLTCSSFFSLYRPTVQV